MRFAIAALLICVMCAPPARGGAWLREHKTAFLSFGSTIRGNKYILPDYETKFYGEYGLRPGLTLGVDLNDIRLKSAHALLFARIPIALATGNPAMRSNWALASIGINSTGPPCTSFLWPLVGGLKTAGAMAG